MANKKSTIEEAAMLPEKETNNPWDRVKIKLPRSKNDGDLFVSVNNYTAQIKRGVVVEVPRCVADVIEQSIEQDEATFARIDQLTAKADY